MALNCYIHHLVHTSRCLSSILLMPFLVLLSSKMDHTYPGNKQMFILFSITILPVFFTCVSPFIYSSETVLYFISIIIWNALLEMLEKHLSVVPLPATTKKSGTHCWHHMVQCAVRGTWSSLWGSDKLLCVCHWCTVRRDCSVLPVLPRQWRNKISMPEYKQYLDQMKPCWTPMATRLFRVNCLFIKRFCD